MKAMNKSKQSSCVAKHEARKEGGCPPLSPQTKKYQQTIVHQEGEKKKMENKIILLWVNAMIQHQKYKNLQSDIQASGKQLLFVQPDKKFSPKAELHHHNKQ